MRKLLIGPWLLAALVVCNGCGDSNGPAPVNASSAASAAPPTAPGEPTQAQPRLQTLKLWLGPEEIVAELALTGLQMQTGMMFRTNMAENTAMLFVFPQAHQAQFWMKNTFVPLSAAYIDPEGVILEIHPLEPHNTNSVVAGSDHVQYVLETPQGWFDRHNIHTGAVVRTELGSLRQTFFKPR
jgi:hypothetical protein